MSQKCYEMSLEPLEHICMRDLKWTKAGLISQIALKSCSVYIAIPMPQLDKSQ